MPHRTTKLSIPRTCIPWPKTPLRAHLGFTPMALSLAVPRDYYITTRDAIKRGNGDHQRALEPSGSGNTENTSPPHFHTEHNDCNYLREARTNTPGSVWDHVEMEADCAPRPIGRDGRARGYIFKQHFNHVHLYTHRPNNGTHNRRHTTGLTDIIPDGAWVIRPEGCYNVTDTLQHKHTTSHTYLLSYSLFPSPSIHSDITWQPLPSTTFLPGSGKRG